MADTPSRKLAVILQADVVGSTVVARSPVPSSPLRQHVP